MYISMDVNKIRIYFASKEMVNCNIYYSNGKQTLQNLRIGDEFVITREYPFYSLKGMYLRFKSLACGARSSDEN